MSFEFLGAYLVFFLGVTLKMQFEDLALKKAERGQITPFSLFHGWERYLEHYQTL